MSRSHIVQRNAFYTLLIAAVLMLRALVPQGYMLAGDGAEGFVIEVCNSEQSMVIPMKDTGPDHGDEDAAEKGCAFASAQGNATTPDPNLRLPLPQLAEAAYDAVRERALSPSTQADLPPATGPPALV